MTVVIEGRTANSGKLNVIFAIGKLILRKFARQEMLWEDEQKFELSDTSSHAAGSP